MAHRNLWWGIGVLLLAAFVALWFMRRAENSPSPTTRAAIVATVKKMLVLSEPSVPERQVPKGTTPSATSVRQLLQEETHALKSVYVANSQAYRQNLESYRIALSQVGSKRRFNVRVARFLVASLTVSGNSASVEWQATVDFVTTVRVPGSKAWASPSNTTQHLVGTTVMQEASHGWRVSSGVQNTGR